MAVTLIDINNGIYNTFVNNMTTVNTDYIQNYNSLTEGLANTPAMQVYWNTLEPVAVGSETERNTFGSATVKPMRHKEFTYMVDLYCDVRGGIDAFYPQMLPIVDEIINILEAQDAKPFFGVSAIQSFTYNAVRGVTEYSGSNYPVVQFTLNIRIF